MKMRPNYSGQLLDKIILAVITQTNHIAANPDDPGYAAARASVLDAVAWALWEARQRLQARRREQDKP